MAKESPGPGGRISHGGTVTLRMSLGPEKHEIPALVGTSVTTATNALDDLGIHVSRQARIYSTDIDKGQVVKTDPDAGQIVDAGSSVVLYVSKGPKPISIPSVEGESADQATNDLQALGLVVHTADRFDSTIPNGQAITTKPGEGKTRHAGDPITLIVSKGPRLYPVPNVVGMPLSEAIPTIVHAGFKADPKAFAPGGPQKVFRESPGGSQQKGTTIELDYY